MKKVILKGHIAKKHVKTTSSILFIPPKPVETLPQQTSTCDQCNFVYTHDDQLRKHKEEHKNANDSSLDVDTFKCDWLPCGYASNSLINHISEAHGSFG